jgi:hypothetical protein
MVRLDKMDFLQPASNHSVYSHRPCNRSFSSQTIVIKSVFVLVEWDTHPKKAVKSFLVCLTLAGLVKVDICWASRCQVFGWYR